MTKTIAIAPVKKSLIIETDQAHAFEVFTAGLERSPSNTTLAKRQL